MEILRTLLIATFVMSLSGVLLQAETKKPASKKTVRVESEPEPAAAPKPKTDEKETPVEITTSSGLKITDLVTGTGAEAVKGKMVEVHYTGTLENGEVFDTSLRRNEPFRFPLGAGRVIEGWDEGVQGMKEGGKRKLVIPSKLAYGVEGVPGAIPPGETLTFEVELLKVK